MNDQPITLDPTKPEIPDDAPLAQGHSREDAENVREAQAALREQVEAEAEQPDVGAREPGDHAGESDDEEGVPDGSVEEVLAWVGDDHDRAQRALEAERAKPTPRTTLITRLEAI